MPAHLWQYAAGAALLLALLWWIAPDVGQFVFGLVVRVLIGGAVIYGVDLIGKPYGIMVGLNPVTASVLGLLGVPGAALLVLWHGIYG